MGRVRDKGTAAAALLAAFLILCTPSEAAAPSLENAYRALKKVEQAAVQDGSFDAYMARLTDAGREVRKLLDRKKAGGLSATESHLGRSLEAYETAKEVWAGKFRKFEDPALQREHEWFLPEEDLKRYAAAFPALNDPENRRVEKLGGHPGYSNVYRETALRVLWAEAARELDLAGKSMGRK